MVNCSIRAGCKTSVKETTALRWIPPKQVLRGADIGNFSSKSKDVDSERPTIFFFLLGCINRCYLTVLFDRARPFPKNQINEVRKKINLISDRYTLLKNGKC